MPLLLENCHANAILHILLSTSKTLDNTHLLCAQSALRFAGLCS